MKQRKIPLNQLQERLGYQFNNKELLQTALTHRSASAQHNERLEFLGDAMLDSIISSELYLRYPKYNEGQLSHVRTRLVNKHFLAKIAHQLNLSEFIVLGPGERKNQGEKRESLLADCLEALIAAIYLDSHFTTCYEQVIRLFADDLNDIPDTAMLKDSKTRLQEYLQACGEDLPEYEIIRTTGPEHACHFYISCTAAGVSVTSEGNSRKSAEQQAAAKLLAHLLQKKPSTSE